MPSVLGVLERRERVALARAEELRAELERVQAAVALRAAPFSVQPGRDRQQWPYDRPLRVGEVGVVAADALGLVGGVAEPVCEAIAQHAGVGRGHSEHVRVEHEGLLAVR